MSATTKGTVDLHSGLRKANRVRAEWLMLMSEGIIGPEDILAECESPDSKALLKLSLRQILLSRAGWGRKRVGAVLGHILSVTGAKIYPKHATVGWLLDSRVGGRRFAAWLDAFQTKSGPSWQGFPYRRGSDV